MTYPAIPRFALVGGLTLLGLTGLGRTTLAQEATPATEALPTREAPARPAHIHAGTCEELGEIVFPLNPLELPQGEAVGDADEAVVASTSYTPLQVPLDQILGAQHAVNIHFSDERIEEYIACGEIGGVLTEQGALVIALQERNASGFAGVAFLSPSVPAPGAASDVSVFLIPLEAPAAGQDGADVEMDADRAATPAVGGAAATPMIEGDAGIDVGEADADDEEIERIDTSPDIEIGEDVEGVEAGAEDEDIGVGEEEQAVVAPDVDEGAGFATVDLGDPNRVRITAGEELTLVNSGSTARTFVVDELGIEQQLAPGETVSVPLETPGNYRFIVLEDGVEIDDRPLVVE